MFFSQKIEVFKIQRVFVPFVALASHVYCPGGFNCTYWKFGHMQVRDPYIRHWPTYLSQDDVFHFRYETSNDIKQQKKTPKTYLSGRTINLNQQIIFKRTLDLRIQVHPRENLKKLKIDPSLCHSNILFKAASHHVHTQRTEILPIERKVLFLNDCHKLFQNHTKVDACGLPPYSNYCRHKIV